MSKEKREFYFEYMAESKEYQQLSDKPPYVRDSSFELVHVIEYSAYQKAIEALKFYAEREHFSYVGNDDNAPENPSGEPINWECGGCENCSFTLENGGFAEATLKELGELP